MISEVALNCDIILFGHLLKNCSFCRFEPLNFGPKSRKSLGLVIVDIALPTTCHRYVYIDQPETFAWFWTKFRGSKRQKKNTFLRNFFESECLAGSRSGEDMQHIYFHYTCYTHFVKICSANLWRASVWHSVWNKNLLNCWSFSVLLASPRNF